jgi:uncharacterized protein (UPF0333 family)
MKNSFSKRGFAPLILIVIIAVLAIGGGAYYYSQKNRATTSSKIATIKTSSEEVINSSRNPDTSTWQTYNYKGLDFQIKYPSIFTVSEYPNGTTIYSPVLLSNDKRCIISITQSLVGDSAGGIFSYEKKQIQVGNQILPVVLEYEKNQNSKFLIGMTIDGVPTPGHNYF